MRYLDGSAFFNHWLTKLGFLDGWRGVLEPEDEEVVFERLEKRLNDQAAIDSELRMTIPMLYLEGHKPVAEK
jgi:arsenite methyltransferase